MATSGLWLASSWPEAYSFASRSPASQPASHPASLSKCVPEAREDLRAPTSSIEMNWLLVLSWLADKTSPFSRRPTSLDSDRHRSFKTGWPSPLDEQQGNPLRCCIIICARLAELVPLAALYLNPARRANFRKRNPLNGQPMNGSDLGQTFTVIFDYCFYRPAFRPITQSIEL